MFGKKKIAASIPPAPSLAERHRATVNRLREVMEKNYQTKNLAGISAAEFQQRLNEFLALRDSAMESYADPGKQRDLSIQFHWGHDHDFGDFQLKGLMHERHLAIPAHFADEHRAFPFDLRGKKVLDIGAWTGGMSLLFCALGAEVVALEEVKKYTMALEFLKKSFDLSRLTVLNKSLYEINAPQFFDRFDLILFSGVIYHLTDPVLGARIVFNALKDGGVCLIESAGLDDPAPVCSYQGPTVVTAGDKEKLNRSGWNWFIPSPSALDAMLRDAGFQEVKLGPVIDARILGAATRKSHADINRAGLSVRNIR